MSPAARRKKRRAPAAAPGKQRARKKKRKRHLTPPAPPPLPAPRREEQDRLPPEIGLLQVAVPLWVEQLRPMTWEDRMRVRDECLAVLATGAHEKDCLEGIANLACGSRGKPGQVAKAFNALARALALGALQPGGVTFGTMHFEAAP